MIPNLLYVSRSRIGELHDVARLTDMHFVSMARNSVLDLTGFLIATTTHFAQYLEGEQHALDELMASIRSDTRHGELREVAIAPSASRRFPFWRMACFAPTSFASRHVEPMVKWFEVSRSIDAATELVEFMEFSSNTVTGSYLVL